MNRGEPGPAGRSRSQGNFRRSTLAIAAGFSLRPWQFDDSVRAVAPYQARSRRRREKLAYAAYELNELRESFDDVAAIAPKYRDMSVPDLIAATVRRPLAALNQAIKAKGANQFTAA